MCFSRHKTRQLPINKGQIVVLPIALLPLYAAEKKIIEDKLGAYS
jgi:hypothetical protein